MKYRAEYCRIVKDWRKSVLNRAVYCLEHKYNPSALMGGSKSRTNERWRSQCYNIQKLNEVTSTQLEIELIVFRYTKIKIP